MRLVASTQALEYQLQLGVFQTKKSPTKVGTLTPFVLVLATLTILFAAKQDVAKTLRVMTYNIHVGVGMDKKLDLARVAGVINKQHPDLVGLQEVDRGVERTQ